MSTLQPSAHAPPDVLLIVGLAETRGGSRRASRDHAHSSTLSPRHTRGHAFPHPPRRSPTRPRSEQCHRDATASRHQRVKKHPSQGSGASAPGGGGAASPGAPGRSAPARPSAATDSLGRMWLSAAPESGHQLVVTRCRTSSPCAAPSRTPSWKVPQPLPRSSLSFSGCVFPRTVARERPRPQLAARAGHTRSGGRLVPSGGPHGPCPTEEGWEPASAPVQGPLQGPPP